LVVFTILMRFVLLRTNHNPPTINKDMEQHPVPQNVTTFQFRLIGDMTIKQFGYLAGGAILAYVFYKLPLPFFFTWPLAVTAAVGGFGLAFVPIEERPMDVWVLSFIKSVYSPTQFLWSREVKAVPIPKAPVAQTQPAIQSQQTTPNKLQPKGATQGKAIGDVLQGIFGAPTIHPSVRPASVQPPTQQAAKFVGQPTTVTVGPPKKDFFTSLIDGLFPKKSVATPQPPIPSVTGRRLDLSTPPVVAKPGQQTATAAIGEVQKKEEQLEHKLHDLQAELQNKSMEGPRILELQKQLTELLSERGHMEQELITLRQQVTNQTGPPQSTLTPASQPVAPTHVASPRAPQAPTVKVITEEGAVKAGLPRLTTFPNVVTGLIKDSDHNFLPGVLVTVRDREGIPLRALKTNRLGQFAASTPLPNGTYFVEIEDPRVRFTFDRVQITLNGSLVPAIEIIAKSQKELSRAKLEQEIFGTQIH
jgi:PrgI family protein